VALGLSCKGKHHSIAGFILLLLLLMLMLRVVAIKGLEVTRRRLRAWARGTPIDSTDDNRFCSATLAGATGAAGAAAGATGTPGTPGATGAAGAGAPAAAHRPSQVRASHLLLKHALSRRPASFREPDGATRSPEEALRAVEALRAAILRRVAGGEPLAEVFAELAAAHSCCSSAKRGGDLGPFGPGQMQRAFEDGAFALAPGEMSGPVSSDSGVHLILRTA
jgi:peptidyl-prolyl cis-trans isomerase NIMA-interacting 1